MSRPRLLVLALVVVVVPVWAVGMWRTHRSVASRFGTLGHGSWSWFGDPRAVYVAGKHKEIFVGWIDWSGSVTVGAYRPLSGVLSEHVIAHLFHDDHSAPSILVEPDKRLTVFWSGHGGAEMDYRSTLRPEDVSAWGPLEHVPVTSEGSLGFTYPNPVLLPGEGNKLYLFWRGGDWSADYATRSSDGHWSRAYELIRVRGQRPYVKVGSDGRDEIALAFTNGHPRKVLTSIYYAAYRAGSLWTAGGRRIAQIADGPIAARRADLVYNAQATHVSAWLWDVALDPRGRPVIVYATFPSRRRHEYWYADWNGMRWVSHFLTVGGGTISPGTREYEYSGGIALDHSDPSVVYLTRQVGGGFEIERWTTAHGGSRWHHMVVVPAGGTDNVRPFVPRGWDHGRMSLLWLRGHYGYYTTYRTSVEYLR